MLFLDSTLANGRKIRCKTTGSLFLELFTGTHTHHSVNRLPRLRSLAIRTRILPVVDKILQIQTNRTSYVLLAMVDLVMTAHFLLGTVSEQYVSPLSREGPRNSAPHPTTLFCETRTTLGRRKNSRPKPRASGKQHNIRGFMVKGDLLA